MTGLGPTHPAPLRDALERLRLDGAIFFRAELTEGWSFASPLTEITKLLRPGADRMILFHIVAAGRCWISLIDGEKHWAAAGDVIVLPYGDDYLMGGCTPADTVSLLTLMSGPPPWTTMPVLSHGSGGERTDLVCGHLHSDDPLFDPALRALPPVFVVRVPEGPAGRWVASSINYALAVTTDSLPAPPSSTKLPELLLTEVLRLHLATAPMAEHGWIAALHDDVLAPAMARMHTAPEHKWSVAELAGTVGVSRSVLDQRFRDVLGRSPIRYLTEWRMHLADDLLSTTQLSIAAIARRIGYESEEAFSRAFRRSHDSPPGVWRTSQRRSM
ncbi:AraC family transcriptional regulator [Mycolicibacterium psychrotolerans]|uniref:AraC family transcriptional regulator n=1 Tax=Mycolicibacterium psychrotolerans TaxID=216929 RepID=A0A7I7M8Y4_9MYCO|nr:AraC family transcriptional regulator [Mycolicibacterium psychrotolerans]BBX68654.1 AraC family transcriptional regulator [Mycolicibacterium psychrotolerans]